ncbi:MAG: helix-turn-helix transcriptional regulator [Pseudomonadota bacterium]
MIWLDSLFRFSGIGFLLLLAVIVLRDGRAWNSKPFLALTCISLAGLFVGYAPEPLRPPEPVYGISRFLDIPHLVFVWLFALSLYDSSFRATRTHVLIGVLYCAPIFWLRLHDYGLVPPFPNWVFIYGSLTSVALMAHLCFVTLKGRADDLLERRRASRLYFILLIVFVAVSAAVIDPVPNTVFGIDKQTAKILSIWPAIVWGVLWLLTMNQKSAHFGNHPGSGRSIAEQDERLKTTLKELMEHDEAFREAGLTIKSLASQLGVNQHRLRALINQELGYANFSAYLNTFRVEAVKRGFEDPSKFHLPILTIAMDCGYKSLSIFNSAFKSYEGVTPSAYRKGLKA